MLQTQRIEITTRTVFKVILLLLGLFLAWELRGIFFMLFFAFILYSTFDPVVDYFEHRMIPRWASIFVIYFLLFILISIIMVIGANVLIEQAQNLSSDFDRILTSFIDATTNAFPWLQDKINSEEITDKLLSGDVLQGRLISSDTLSSAFGVISSVGSIALGVFVVIMVSVYMLDRQEKFYSGLIDYVPKANKKKVMQLMKRIETGLGAWFIGQVILMFSVGFVTWVGVALPGLFFEDYTLGQYALPIALIAGLLEAVPNIGPTVTVFIAVFIAIGSGNLSEGDATVVILGQSIYVAILGIVIQNLEAMFLVPIVMKKAVGIDPIITILGIISALSLFGIVGAILVIPIVATGQIVFNFYQEENSG